MSIAALLLGAEKWLRAEEQLDDQPEADIGKRIGVQPAPGKPPPGFGQWYLSLHWAGGRGADRLPERSDQYHGIIVTLTARLGYAPRDRQGLRFVTAAELYALADRVVDMVHGKWGLITEANKLIVGTAEYIAIHGGTATVNGFTEALVLDGSYGPERPAPQGWIGSDDKDVFVLDIRFRDARRLRRIY